MQQYLQITAPVGNMESERNKDGRPHLKNRRDLAYLQ